MATPGGDQLEGGPWVPTAYSAVGSASSRFLGCSRAGVHRGSVAYDLGVMALTWISTHTGGRCVHAGGTSGPGAGTAARAEPAAGGR